VEKIIHLNKGLENCYGPTDCLVNRDNPQLFVSNFSGGPVTVFQGQLLGYARNPNTWLDSSQGDPETVKKLKKHASFIKAVTEELKEKGIDATH